MSDPLRVHLRVPGTAPMAELMALLRSVEAAGFDGGVLPLAERAVGDLDRFLLDVEAQRLLALDVAAGHPDEESVVAELDGMDVAHREHRGVAGLVEELL